MRNALCSGEGRSRQRVNGVTWVAIAAVCLVFSRPASAQAVDASDASQADDGTHRARELFLDGVALTEKGDWTGALRALEQSNSLHPHPSTRYNIGYCELKLGHATRARKLLKSVLAPGEGAESLPADQAAAAEMHLKTLEARIAKVLIVASPEGSILAVDGSPLETAPTSSSRPRLLAGTREPGASEPLPAREVEVEVDPGAHTFALSKVGFASASVTRTLAPGSQTSVDISLRPLAAHPALPAVLRTSDAHQAVSNADGGEARSRMPLYVALGTGALGLATGATTGIWALAEKAKVADECTPHVPCGAPGSSDIQRAGTLADISTAGFIVAGVSVAAAMAWWLWPRSAATAAPRSSTWTPAGSALVGVF